MVKFDRYVGSCNAFNDLSDKTFIPNKTEDLNLSMFNMITGKMNKKYEQSMYHANVNVNLME